MNVQTTTKIAYTSKEMEKEITELTRDLDDETIFLAAIAYGEASTLNDSEEIGGIAFAVANRARAWNNKKISELINEDENYTFVVSDGNARYSDMMKIKDPKRYKLLENTGMRLAVQWAKKALKNQETDPSNGAFWWDGLDIKTNYSDHPKVIQTFHFDKLEHNIFGIQETSRKITKYWQIKDPKTDKLVNSTIRGQYQYVWVSTAAYGKTIFWIHDEDYIKATGCKIYK